jgi:hypothetical protein
MCNSIAVVFEVFDTVLFLFEFDWGSGKKVESVQLYLGTIDTGRIFEKIGRIASYIFKKHNYPTETSQRQ